MISNTFEAVRVLFGKAIDESAQVACIWREFMQGIKGLGNLLRLLLRDFNDRFRSSGDLSGVLLGA